MPLTGDREALNDPMDAIERLRTLGDPIERHILNFYDDPSEFAVLKPYAQIWSTYIEPNRRAGISSKVEPEWTPFASRHYTALIRTFTAHTAGMQAVLICGDLAGKKGDALVEGIIRFHECSASFWWNVGAAIDNFFGASKFTPKKCFGNTTMDKRHYSTLKESYELRNQYIHDPLVPVAPDKDGYFKFNEKLLDGNETNWDNPRQSIVFSETYYQGAMTDFFCQMYKAWETLYSKMKSSQTKVVKTYTPSNDSVISGSSSTSHAPSGVLSNFKLE